MTSATGSRARGFTLIEVLTVMVLVVILGTLAISGFQRLTRANLRKSARELSYAITFFHQLSVAQNSLIRMVVDFDERTATFEKGVPLPIGTRFNEIQAEEDLFADDSELNEESLEERRIREELERAAAEGDVASGLSLRYRFVRLSGNYRTVFKLPANILFRGVQTQRDEDIQTEGKAVAYFFPNGFTDRTFIYLEQDDGSAVRTLVVQPMTGRTFIFGEFVDRENSDALKGTM